MTEKPREQLPPPTTDQSLAEIAVQLQRIADALSSPRAGVRGVKKA